MADAGKSSANPSWDGIKLIANVCMAFGGEAQQTSAG
jgi:hypothetical protein